MNTTTKTRPTTKAPAPPKPSTRKPPPAPPKPATSGSIEMPALMLRKVIAVITPAASSDDARPILCNVAIEIAGDGASTWMATDSYRLHHLVLAPQDWLHSGPATGQIPAWWLQRWARGKFSKHAVVRLSWTPTSSTIACDGMTDTIEHEDYAAFPAVKPLMDEAMADPTVHIAHFNPRYLATMLTACAKWGQDDYYAPVKLDPIAPGLFAAKSVEGVFTGLLMPVRVP